MKTFLFSISTTIAMMIATSCASVNTATPEVTNLIKNKVAAKNYTIDARMANPMRGKAIVLNYGYELQIKADSAYAYLPYYGVAQRAPYGNTDGGIKFDEPMKDYTIKSKKKDNGWDISFKVETKDYNYELNLSIFNNGNASFTVNTVDRDVISFTGEVKK